MALKLSAKEIRYIALFENLTAAVVKDCIVDEKNNRVIFVVKKGDVGVAIGRKGSNIQKVRQSIGKKVDVVEYSEDPREFVRNILHPLRVQDVSIADGSGKKVAKVKIDVRDKAELTALGNKKLDKARMLAQRHHQMDISIL